MPAKDYFKDKVTGEYQILFRVYGKNGVLGELEPQKEIMSHELCIIVEVVARTQEFSEYMCSRARIGLLHVDYEGRKATSGNVGFIFTPFSYLFFNILTYEAYRVSGLPKNRIIGQAGVLDSARYRTFIAQELNVSVNDVSALVLGVHGDEMVPLPRYTLVNGVPIAQLISDERIDEIIMHTRSGGAEIINLLGNGSAFYAPAASLVQMAESILLDLKRVTTGVAYLEGEYGYNNIVLGVPLILGSNGIEQIIEVQLLEHEKRALDESSKVVELGLKSLNRN